MGDQDLFSVFVDNLPKDMDVIWLKQLFSGFGLVMDAYMPNRRSSTFNTKFGFIKYRYKEEACGAIQALNGIIIRDFRMVVQFAKFSMNRNHNKGKLHTTLMGMNKSVNKIWMHKDLNSLSKADQRSYAHALVGGSIGGINDDHCKSKIVEANEVDLEWLNRSAVGELVHYRDVDSLHELFISNGIWDAQFRSMGGRHILFTLDSRKSMESFLEENKKCLSLWFSSVEMWHNQRIKPSRCTWISCYGVPLSAWHSETFHNIGKLMGEVIKLDEITAKSIAFDKGRMFIVTDQFHCINEMVDLKVRGEVYPIKIVEDPFAETSWENRIVTSIKVKKHLYQKSDVLIEEEVENVHGNSKEAEAESSDGVHIQISKDVEGLSLHSINNYVIGDSCSPMGVDQAGEDIRIGEARLDSCEFGMRTIKDAILKPTQVLEPSVEDSMGIHSLFHETHDVELVEKSKSLEEFSEVYSDDSIMIAKAVSGRTDFDDSDLVSNEPLFMYVEHRRQKKSHKRQKKSHKAKKGSSFKEKVSSNIHQRNSILVKEARENMKMGVRFGVKFHGRESFNIKKLLELQGIDISEQVIKAEIKALDLLEGDASFSMEF